MAVDGDWVNRSRVSVVFSEGCFVYMFTAISNLGLRGPVDNLLLYNHWE